MTESDAIQKIVTIGLIFELILKEIQSEIPNSMLIALIRSTFAGLMRDSVDAVNSNDLTTIAKYWQISFEGTDPIRDGATEDQIKSMILFKKKVDEILGSETLTWPDFDKI